MTTRDRPGPGWTLVLRRQPIRIVAGQAEGGYTDAFEIICSGCGDRPELDYGEVSLELRRVRGPYSLVAGVIAYEKHGAWHRDRNGQAATEAMGDSGSPGGRAVVMSADSCPVRWTGRRAVVTFPEQIDVSNAGQIAGELLSLINRGAAELIADMTATVACDYAGADAVVRAYRRAAVSGTQLRLVVTAPVVRRVLTVNGLDRLIPIYPWLEAAVAAGTEGREVQADPEAAGLSPATDRADHAEELLDWVVNSIFDIGVVLQAAAGLPRGTAEKRITEAAGRLDDVVREVRNRAFAGPARGTGSGLARSSPSDMQKRLTQAAGRAASLKERLVQTAQILQLAAARAAALLEQQADLAGQPGRIDYPAEIKRWREFADQAEHMANHWEQGL